MTASNICCFSMCATPLGAMSAALSQQLPKQDKEVEEEEEDEEQGEEFVFDDSEDDQGPRGVAGDSLQLSNPEVPQTCEDASQAVKDVTPQEGSASQDGEAFLASISDSAFEGSGSAVVLK